MQDTRVTISLAMFSFVAVKFVRYMSSCKREETSNKIDKIRNRLFYFRVNLRKTLGEKSWFILSDILGDNLWISILVVGSIMNTSAFDCPKTFEQKIALMAAIPVMCSAAWGLRFAFSKGIPIAKAIVAQRYIN